MSEYIIYPLSFFNRLPELENAMKSIPGNITIDATFPPEAFTLAICTICNTGSGVARKEINEKYCYSCTVCGQTTPMYDTVEEASAKWTKTNQELLTSPSSPTTN